MEPEYPSNSKKQKRAAAEPKNRPEVQKVITGTVVRKKEGPGKKFRRLFLSGPDARGVVEFTFTEHVIPGLRDLVYDSITGGLHQRFYGDQPGYRRQQNPISNGLGLLTNYAAASRGPAGGAVAPSGGMSRRARSTHNFGEIVFPTKPEAEITLETMYEIIGRHEECTVAEFLQMCGEVPDFTDEGWGWQSLEHSRVRRNPGGGYVIDLPPTVEL